MKYFGYELNEERLIELQEVTIQTAPDDLRSLARFLDHAADQLEKHGASFGHEHYKDRKKDHGGVDLIVIRSGLSSA